MNLIDKVSNKIASKSAYYALLREFFFEFKMLHLYNGSFKMKKDKKKLEARIIIGSHGIEKGLSYSTPKNHFGIPKIEFLLDNLLYYKKKYNDENFIIEQAGPIKEYINYHNNSAKEIQGIINRYNQLIKNINSPVVIDSGTVKIQKENIINAVNIDYQKFVKARHSYRSFSQDPVDVSEIEKALEIAQMTPSACNRQPWKVYLFKGDKKNELLKLQQGSMGFYEEIDKAILITVDYRNFFLSELHQAYVDGGLYAMNLLHALHSLELGTIPLTAGGFTKLKKKVLFEKWNIPMNEVPIMIIGVGYIKEITNVAVSKRNNYKDVLQIIE